MISVKSCLHRVQCLNLECGMETTGRAPSITDRLSLQVCPQNRRVQQIFTVTTMAITFARYAAAGERALIVRTKLYLAKIERSLRYAPSHAYDSQSKITTPYSIQTTQSLAGAGCLWRCRPDWLPKLKLLIETKASGRSRRTGGRVGRSFLADAEVRVQA